MSVRKRKAPRKNPDHLDRLSREQGYPSYHAYLQSPKWQAFAASVLQARCYCCQRDRPLQVHHVTYARLGREQPSDVVTVCNGCHVRIHEMVAAGTPLKDAHEKLRKLRSSGWGVTSQWIGRWQDLPGAGNDQPQCDLRAQLEGHGLLDGDAPSRKALANGYARRNEDGTVAWHRKRWLGLRSRALKDGRRREKRQEEKRAGYQEHLANMRERFARRMRDIADTVEQDLRRPLAMELMRDTLTELGFGEGIAVLENMT